MCLSSFGCVRACLQRWSRHAESLINHYCSETNYLASRTVYYAIENPRGVMRKLAPLPPDATVWYCRLGDERAKPTDLWTNIPVRLPAMCRNGNPDCTHQRAPRGAKTGTQGLQGTERALVPYGLSLTMCMGVEYAKALKLEVNPLAAWFDARPAHDAASGLGVDVSTRKGEIDTGHGLAAGAGDASGNSPEPRNVDGAHE